MSVGKIVKNYFKCHRLRAIGIIIMIILVTLIALFPAQILRLIIDDAIEYENKERLIIYSICYGVCFLLIGVITFIKDVVMLSSSQGITKDLRSNMMRHIHRLSYKSLVNTDSGTLEAYFNNDVNSMNQLFTSGVISMITDLFKMLGILITLFIYSYIFGLGMLLILPVLILFTSLVRKGMLKAQLKTKSLEGGVNKELLENVENIEQIKINKAEPYAKRKYNSILKGHFNASQASNFYDAIFSPFMQIVRNLVVVSILLVSGYNSSIFGMSVGMIISAISLITDLFSPIENLGMEIQTIQKSMASVRRINAFFKMDTDEKKKDYSINGNHIEFKDVSFSYDEKPVIESFSLSIQSGDRIALKGASGAGKSTLMKLSMGQIKPNSGFVTIDGVNANDLSDKTKEKLFSIVYQDPFFSGGSIYEEITLLNSSITEERVFDALNTVGLSYIKDINQKLIPSNYSSGELALFNIARVVVRDTPIVFLDEMNAKIDPLTAKTIMEVINRITQKKIVISINHYGDVLNNAKIITIEASK